MCLASFASLLLLRCFQAVANFKFIKSQILEVLHQTMTMRHNCKSPILLKQGAVWCNCQCPGGMQVLGLSAGMFLGTICNSIIYAIMCIRTDWQRAVSEALERTGKSDDEKQRLLEGNDEESALDDETS